MGKWDQHIALANQRDTWLGLLREALGPPPWASFARPVAITYKLRGVGRRTDSFNWGGHRGLKVLQDCLTAPKGSKDYGLSILPDDGWRWVPQVPRVLIDPDGEGQTTVEIMELDTVRSKKGATRWTR